MHEYRAIDETPEEEWNLIYNNKKISIEALQHIELKKRGKGPVKNVYEGKSDKPGPFYDPNSSHVHIFKKDSLIVNFLSEQDPRCNFIQYRDYKPGTYCCICHCSCQKFQFNFLGEDKGVKRKFSIPFFSLDEQQVTKKEEVTKNEEVVQTKRSYDKDWKRIITRGIHSLTNKRILYPISNRKSLLLWPWQLTPYQKFKLENPKYKNSCIFVKSKIEEFRDDYAVIA